MKKKFLIILGTIVAVFIVALVLLPIIFEAKIGTLLKDNVNAQIEGEFDFDDVSLSLISSFPSAKLSLQGARLQTPEPFKGDTLFYAKSLNLKMAIMEIFKGAGDPINIKDISVDGAKLDLKVNADDEVNYDITRNNSEDGVASDESTDFSFLLNSYSINNSEINYSSSPSNIDLGIYLEEHTGSGDFSLSNSKLDTQTKGLLSLQLDSIAYLSATPFDLKALIGMDLEQYRYQFLENQALLKDLALVFEGEVKVEEDYQDIDIRFNAPAADFRDFLALMPETFVQDLNRVEASGDLEVSGTIKGVNGEETIPGFDIRVRTDNARVQYADLPRPIDQITLDAALVNTTGKPEGTQLDVQKSSFAIAQDRFQLQANVGDLLGDKRWL
ncbi:MAG: AsmA family protein [Eudoraea sp.]|nr:AsmA family protein [Eudoraea sp.]